MAAGIALEAVLTLAIRRNVQTPCSNLELMDWIAFALSIGFLVIGATMGWVLVATARSTCRRAVGGGLSLVGAGTTRRTEFYYYAVTFGPFLVIAITLCLGLIIGPARAEPSQAVG